jgi:hypothetical protein
MRTKPVTLALTAVALAAAMPASASAFPEQGSCAGEGAFVSGNAQQFGAGFGGLVSGTAQTAQGLADVIAASHAVNCEPRP